MGLARHWKDQSLQLRHIWPIDLNGSGLCRPVHSNLVHKCIFVQNSIMNITLDLPDPLFNRLKALAAQEGKSISDLLIELVEKSLSAKNMVDEQQRFQAKPLIRAKAQITLPLQKLTNADLSELVNQDDDERARQFLQSH